MPTIGLDCNITLTHADINAGLPYGFLLDQRETRIWPALFRPAHPSIPME